MSEVHHGETQESTLHQRAALIVGAIESLAESGGLTPGLITTLEDALTTHAPASVAPIQGAQGQDQNEDLMSSELPLQQLVRKIEGPALPKEITPLPPMTEELGHYVYGKVVNDKGEEDYSSIVYTPGKGSFSGERIGDRGLHLPYGKNYRICEPGYIRWRENSGGERRPPRHGMAEMYLFEQHVLINVWSLIGRPYIGGPGLGRRFYLEDYVFLDPDNFQQLLRQGYNVYGGLCQEDVPYYEQVLGLVKKPTVDFRADRVVDNLPESWIGLPGWDSDSMLQLVTQAFISLRNVQNAPQASRYETEFGIDIVNYNPFENRRFTTREKVLFIQFLSHLFAQLPEDLGSSPLTSWTTERGIRIFGPRLGFREDEEPSFEDPGHYRHVEIKPWQFSGPSPGERGFMDYLRDTFAKPWDQALATWETDARELIYAVGDISKPNTRLQFPPGVPFEPPDRMPIPPESDKEPYVWRVSPPVKIEAGSSGIPQKPTTPDEFENDVPLPVMSEEVQAVIARNLGIFKAVIERVQGAFISEMESEASRIKKGFGSDKVRLIFERIVSDYQESLEHPGIRATDQSERLNKSFISLVGGFADSFVHALLSDVEVEAEVRGLVDGRKKPLKDTRSSLKAKIPGLREILNSALAQLAEEKMLTQDELRKLQAAIAEEYVSISSK